MNLLNSVKNSLVNSTIAGMILVAIIAVSIFFILGGFGNLLTSSSEFITCKSTLALADTMYSQDKKQEFMDLFKESCIQTEVFLISSKKKLISKLSNCEILANTLSNQEIFLSTKKEFCFSCFNFKSSKDFEIMKKDFDLSKNSNLKFSSLDVESDFDLSLKISSSDFGNEISFEVVELDSLSCSN